MSEVRDNLLYTKSHEWVKKSSNPKVVVMGISDFAQAALGDVTYLDLPAVGRMVKAGETVGSVESVKAVSDLYAPVSGKVVKRNDALTQDPTTLNQKPYDDAWMIEIEISDETELAKLLAPAAYASVAQ